MEGNKYMYVYSFLKYLLFSYWTNHNYIHI